MSLDALRLHHGRRIGDAVPEGAAVAGATPLFRCLVRHRGGLDVHGHPPSVGSDPKGRGQGCENTPASEPAPGPRPGGSLPSTSVLPSAAQAAGWQRPQLQAPARDSRIRRLRIFRGAMRASTANVSCTLQYGTRRGLLIGSVPPRAEPPARCRCVASAPALPACAPASSARRCASSRPASLGTPSGPGHPP